MTLPVYSASDLIKILNTDTELAAFPIEGEASLLFTFPIDLQNIKSYIFLIREKPQQDPVSISLNEVKQIGDVNVDYFDIVKYTYTTSVSSADLGSKPIITIKAAEPLLPNNNYKLVISKNLTGGFYAFEKTNSLGPSAISLIIDPTADITGIPSDSTTTYGITITASSQITNGIHTISYTLTKNSVPVATNVSIDIKAFTITIGTGIQVKFNSNTPFIINEVFNVYLTRPTRNGVTKVQKIVTYLDSDVVPLPADEETKKLSEEDILNFYSRFGYGRRLDYDGSTVVSPEVLGSDEIKFDAEFSFIFPNQILIDVGAEIDPDTLTADAFAISLAPAFDNYFLQNMGYFDTSAKYIIKYKLIENDFGVSQIIRLVVIQDTTNVVPSDQLFVIQADT